MQQAREDTARALVCNSSQTFELSTCSQSKLSRKKMLTLSGKGVQLVTCTPNFLSEGIGEFTVAMLM